MTAGSVTANGGAAEAVNGGADSSGSSSCSDSSAPASAAPPARRPNSITGSPRRTALNNANRGERVTIQPQPLRRSSLIDDTFRRSSSRRGSSSVSPRRPTSVAGSPDTWTAPRRQTSPSTRYQPNNVAMANSVSVPTQLSSYSVPQPAPRRPAPTFQAPPPPAPASPRRIPASTSSPSLRPQRRPVSFPSVPTPSLDAYRSLPSTASDYQVCLSNASSSRRMSVPSGGIKQSATFHGLSNVPGHRLALFFDILDTQERFAKVGLKVRAFFFYTLCDSQC